MGRDCRKIISRSAEGLTVACCESNEDQESSEQLHGPGDAESGTRNESQQICNALSLN